MSQVKTLEDVFDVFVRYINVPTNLARFKIVAKFPSGWEKWVQGEFLIMLVQQQPPIANLRRAAVEAYTYATQSGRRTTQTGDFYVGFLKGSGNPSRGAIIEVKCKSQTAKSGSFESQTMADLNKLWTGDGGKAREGRRADSQYRDRRARSPSPTHNRAEVGPVDKSSDVDFITRAQLLIGPKAVLDSIKSRSETWVKSNFSVDIVYKEAKLDLPVPGNSYIALIYATPETKGSVTAQKVRRLAKKARASSKASSGRSKKRKSPSSGSSSSASVSQSD